MQEPNAIARPVMLEVWDASQTQADVDRSPEWWIATMAFRLGQVADAADSACHGTSSFKIYRNELIELAGAAVAAVAAYDATEASE